MLISFVEKKPRLTTFGQGAKESDPKRMLLCALAKGNIYGKKVAFKRQRTSPPRCLKPKRQALLHVSVCLLPFTPAPARRFGSPARMLAVSNWLTL